MRPVNLDVLRGFDPDVSQSYHNRYFELARLSSSFTRRADPFRAALFQLLNGKRSNVPFGTQERSMYWSAAGHPEHHDGVVDWLGEPDCWALSFARGWLGFDASCCQAHGGRLSAPFAPSAGWGDIITGIAAIPMAAMAASHRGAPRRLLTAWNTFGALDLVAAVTLAFMSAPGTPYRVFTEGPGTVAMTTLPWILAATFLVPLCLLTHFVIAVRLRLSRSANVTPLENAPARRRTA